MGDLVRYKLNAVTRDQRGGKIGPRYSEAYQVVKVKENKYTYVIKPVEGSKGYQKIRHFNDLKTVSREDTSNTEERTVTSTDGSGQTELTTDGDTNGPAPAGREGEPEVSASNIDRPEVRRSNRNRTKTQFLQAGAKGKAYTETPAQLSDNDSD